MSVGNSRRAWRSGDHARRRSAGGSITLIMGWLQCAGHAPVLCILQARGGSSPLAWETHAPHCSSHPLAPISPPAQTGGLRSGRGVTRLENGLPGAVVHGCFHKRLFFRVLFISPVFLDDCAHPRDFPANPRNPSSTWRRPMDSLRESRATRLEVRGISPEPCVRPSKLLDGPPNDCVTLLGICVG